MLVPVSAELCISSRQVGEPRLSPDGHWVAMTGSWGGSPAIVVVPAAGGPEQAVTVEPAPKAGRGGGSFDWLPGSDGLVHTARDGNLWLVAFPGGPARQLTSTGTPERAAHSPAVDPTGSRVAYVIDLAELRIVDLPGARSDLADVAVPTTAAFVNDPVWDPTGDVVAWQEWSPPAMAWDDSRIGRWSVAADRLLDPLGSSGRQCQQPRFGPSGELWSLRDDDGWLNVWRGDSPVVAEPCEHGGPTWGPGQRSFVVAPDGRQVAFTRNESGFGRLCVHDLATGSTRALGRGVHGQLGWVGTTIVATRSGAVTPPEVVAYDAVTGARRVLARTAPTHWSGTSGLVEPEAVEWEGDDGGRIPGRLYRTAPNAGGDGSAGDPADGRLIVWIHGGPTDQWPVAFLPRVAFWVSRGWNVLVPDARGSTGSGRAHQQAMARRWGDLDVADVAAGISAAHLRGWGRPDRTVVMGGSAGGFTALHLATHVGLCAGVAVSYPVCDLILLDETTHRFEAHYHATLVGPRPGSDAVARERSPSSFASRVAVPVLVLHGDADPVVGVEQSRNFVAAVLAAGGRAELHVYEGEGHGFRLPANRLDELARIEAFVGRLVPVP